MHLKRKISLIAIVVALAFVLLNMAPQVAFESGVDGIGVIESPYHDYGLSGELVQEPPVASDDFYTANEGFTLLVPAPGVLANDVDADGDDLAAELADWPAYGILTLNPDGSFEYFVDGWSGPVIFTYMAFDGTEYSAPATVLIDVIPDDDQTGPEIDIIYSGDSTDNDPGTWTVTVVDLESGVDSISVEINGVLFGTGAGVYAVPNSLGSHTIFVTATNADLDTGPSDQETSTLSNTVNIVDDDITGPTISIIHTGDATNVNPGIWTIAVFDSISGIQSIIVDVDGTVVGTVAGEYTVPSSIGDHIITVTAFNNDLDRPTDQETSILSNTITIESTITPTELAYTGDSSGVYSDLVYLEARLTEMSTGVPIPGKWIVFTVGMFAVEVLTDSSGIASYILIIDQQPGVYTLDASFSGDDDYLDSSDSCEFVIAKEYAFAEYTGRTVVPTSDDKLTLMATIFDEDDGYWGDLTRIYVTFSLYLESKLAYETGPIIVETTDVQGVGLAISEIENLDAGEYLVVVRFDSLYNRYYYGPETEATTTIYVPEREYAHGAGYFKDEDGRRIYFVFNVHYSCRGNLKGFFFLTYRVNHWFYFVRSTEILSLTVDGPHGIFEANARLSQFNLRTHERIRTDETYRFRVDVWDNKGRGEKDAFQIRVYDSNGLLEYEVGFDPVGFLVRGNISIREHRRRHW
ncbi:MAG: Ig-like domain-containing protein [Candidatus Thorarchaeota archaeon]